MTVRTQQLEHESCQTWDPSYKRLFHWDLCYCRLLKTSRPSDLVIGDGVSVPSVSRDKLSASCLSDEGLIWRRPIVRLASGDLWLNLQALYFLQIFTLESNCVPSQKWTFLWDLNCGKLLRADKCPRPHSVTVTRFKSWLQRRAVCWPIIYTHSPAGLRPQPTSCGNDVRLASTKNVM